MKLNGMKIDLLFFDRLVSEFCLNNLLWNSNFIDVLFLMELVKKFFFLLCIVIYFGDYKWFEIELEEELESELFIGSLLCDRSYSFNEFEWDWVEIKEIEDKGLLFFCKYYKNIEYKFVVLIMY